MSRKYENLQGDIIVKKQFLDNMRNIDKNTEGTVANAEIILRRFGKHEKKLNKDVYNFNIQELDDMMMSLRIGSSGDASRIGSVLKKYLLFAHSKKLGNLSLNMQTFFKKERLDTYVWPYKERGKIFTLEQVVDISRLIENPRDRLIIWLLWLGIKGEKFDELRMLKKSDVDMEQNFIVTNQKIVRDIPTFVINLTEEVNNTNEYYVINKYGDIREKPITLKDNGFLLRPIEGQKGKYTEGFITNNAFKQTFTNIKKSFLELYPGFSPLNIYKSGMLWNFNEYIKKNNIKLKYNNDDLDIFNKFRQTYYSDRTLSYSLYGDFLRKYKIIKKEDGNT